MSGLRSPQAFMANEAEQSVLGALLIDNTAWDRVADLLREQDFYRHEHRLIFAAVGKLVNSGKAADAVTVFEQLRRSEDEEAAGGLSYINGLTTSVTGARNCRRYAEIVKEKALLRGLVAKADQVYEIAAGEQELAEKLDTVAALFSGTDAINSRRMPSPMSDVMVEVIDGINEALEGGGEFWRTGIPGLDSRLFGGLRPGDLLVLAARPSVGKTSFALQVAKRVASDGYPSLILSQEMLKVALGRRALASDASVNMGHIKTGKLDENEWRRVAEGTDRLGSLPLWIDDEPALKPAAMAAKARYVRGVKLLVVDYIQLSEGTGETRSAQVGSISRGLKRLAKELGAAVIALSQLNRAVDARPGKRPQMSDLRDSGEIEQDADMIAFLWPLADDEGQPIRSIGFDLAKNRDGERGAFVLNLHGAIQCWTESTQGIDDFLVPTTTAKPKKEFK